MYGETISLSRTELYEKVWSVPMARLAREYGFSDVGLAKICRKHNIPRPPRGYWAKKSAGQNPKKIPLPHPRRDITIEIRSPSHPEGIFKSEIFAQKEELVEVYGKIEIRVPERLHKPHPLIGQSAEILRSCEPNDVGILEPPKADCLNIKVSPKSLGRALRIMDPLVKFLEEHGHRVYLSGPSTLVQILDIDISFGISESLVTVRHQPKDHDLDGDYRFGHSRYDEKRVPSGKLCLTIHERLYWAGSPQKNWRDLETTPLEERVEKFIAGLSKTAALKRDYLRREEEKERERRERRRRMEEERRIRAELLQKIRKERQHVENLIHEAENWHRSKLIRAYITAVKKRNLAHDFSSISEKDFDQWIKWAMEQADRLDPLTPSPPSILDTEIEEDGS